MRLVTLVLTTIILTFYFSSFGQKKIKFGKILDEHLNLEQCSFDPEAGAVVLYDGGSLWFDVSASGQFQLNMERHIRLKILNQSEFGQADIEIPYYTGDDNRASISGVKAHTIIPGTGKDIEVVKVEKSNIFKQKDNDYYSSIKFSFPKVDEGVILEYKYKLVTPYLSALKTWVFQRNIPVLNATYEARIPDFYDCTVNVVGHSTESITHKRTSLNEELFLYNVHLFKGENIPSLRKEKYATSIHNYTTKARFVVRSLQITGRPIEMIAGDYSEFNKTLLEGDRFKALSQRQKFLEGALLKITRSNDKLQDLRNISTYIKSNTLNDDYEYFYPNQSAKATLSGQPSNSSAINMLQTLIMISAGYQAEALILGTRDYIRPHPFDPDFSDFNHLVTLVTLENGKSYIFDAASQLADGKPEARVFNGLGWVVSEGNGRKINLSDMAQAKFMVNTICNIKPGSPTRSEITIRSNYLGIHRISEEDNYEAEKFKLWLLESKDRNISDYHNDNTSGVSNISFNCDMDDVKESEIIYFTPDYFGMLDYDIFRGEDRKTPIDFPYKINLTNIVTMSIPVGYRLESMPESKKYALDDDGMKFSFIVKSDPQKVNINLRFKVNRNIYLPEKYQDIRVFINEVESTLNEKIVFKKDE